MLKSAFVFAILVFGQIEDTEAECRKAPLRAVNWRTKSGMWYNSLSHKEDATQIDGQCNSMVIAGTKGYDGVAVVRNVMPKAQGMEESLTGVAEFFRALDPGVYQLDPSSQLAWMNIDKLEKLMPREKIPSFMNAIVQHYTTHFQVLVSKNFFVISQCDCRQTRNFIWVYTLNPNPTDEEEDRIKRFLSSRRIKVELQRNEACYKSLYSFYEKANGVHD